MSFLRRRSLSSGVGGGGAGLVNLTKDTANDGHPRWLPDGICTACEFVRTGCGRFFIMNREAKTVFLLTPDGASNGWPEWG